MLVMLSGGRDSVCLLHKLREQASGAMHMNYGLRAEADADADFCRELCRDLGIALTVVRPESAPAGNLQAWARAERYAAALGLTDGDVAVGHTASDQVETVLYRLLSSPGRRPLAGMAARSGRLVRPLLSMTRAETTAYCVANGLSWRDDASNADSRFARNRIRELLSVHPAAEANVLRTLEQLVEEGEVLDALVQPEPSIARLRSLPPALLRLTLQRMADDAGGRVAIGGRVDDVLAGADLGGGLRSVVEHGNLRFAVDRKTGSPPVTLTVPGRVPWGTGVITAAPGVFAIQDGVLDAPSLGARLEVRSWRPGDRMRPLGMQGHSKSLQDLFTDRKIPRERRHQLPVVVSDGEIAWIPGVATGEAFRAGKGLTVRLAWELTSA